MSRRSSVWPAAPLPALALIAWLAAAASAASAQTAPTPPAPAQSAPVQAEPAQAAPTFDGIWMFDAAHSDDPMKVMQQNAPRREGGGAGGGGFGRGGGGGWGGRGGGGGFGGRHRGGGEGGTPQGETNSRGGGDPRRAFERVMHPAHKLVLYLDHDRFQVAEDEGTPRVYTLSDSLKALGVKPLTDEATVQIHGRRLEAKQPLGARGALLETYELSGDGRTLTIRAHREGGREGMPNPTFTRTYTRYEGE